MNQCSRCADEIRLKSLPKRFQRPGPGHPETIRPRQAVESLGNACYESPPQFDGCHLRVEAKVSLEKLRSIMRRLMIAVSRSL